MAGTLENTSIWSVKLSNWLAAMSWGHLCAGICIPPAGREVHLYLCICSASVSPTAAYISNSWSQQCR